MRKGEKSRRLLNSGFVRICNKKFLHWNNKRQRHDCSYPAEKLSEQAPGLSFSLLHFSFVCQHLRMRMLPGVLARIAFPFLQRGLKLPVHPTQRSEERRVG